MIRRLAVLKVVLGILAITAATAVTVLIGWRTWLVVHYRADIRESVDEVPTRRVAIVLGAGIRGDRPTAVLASRIEAAAALYRAGRVEKLLMTGDNSYIDYNEPGAMQAYALQLGIPAEDIVLDYAGRRTYDSCYRARAIFGLDEAVVVTQRFHLPRSLYLCEQMGVKAVGLAADQSRFSTRLRLTWEARETVASAAAWWDTHVAKPLPILGDPLPIED
jgi:SanA protein